LADDGTQLTGDFECVMCGDAQHQPRVNAIIENVRRQVARLKISPPVVQKLYLEKKIGIFGGVYDLATGKIALI
jgi:carbonic anhydrase